MKKHSPSELKTIARQCRIDIVQMLAAAGSGHTGGSLSSIDLLVVLYFNILNHDPNHPSWPERDYFILSAGHLCPALYAVMAHAGYFPKETLMTLRQLGSPLQGHPSHIHLPGIETSTGSLGQGINVGVGVALGLKMEKKPNRTFVLMGDGEQEEGSVWEAAMAASHYKLGNLVGIVDLNGQQQNGPTKEIMDSSPLSAKYQAFGWDVIECNGNDIQEVLDVFAAVRFGNRPTVILAKTTMGKGVPAWENDYSWHGKAPKKEEVEESLRSIKG
ncbi:MAG: transketolase [bacterium]|nr:transketolase [bacterium]